MSHEIICATETPDGIRLVIRWGDAGHQTTQVVSEDVAKALGYKHPAEPPAPPAWRVEVAREAADGYGNGVVAVAERALRLALERGHVVEPRPVPSEEELLAAAIEDAAQASDRDRPHWARMLRTGEYRIHSDVLCALQARRNMLREGAVATAIDVDAHVRAAWDAGWDDAVRAVSLLTDGSLETRTLRARCRDDYAKATLSTLPTREA